MKILLDDRLELLGQLIDVVEDFLEEKGIDIPNPEKEDADDIHECAIIYGTDYGNLSDEFDKILVNWKLINSR